MATDDLSAPLGQSRSRKSGIRRLSFPFTFAQVFAAALALVILTFAGWALMVEDPLGGEPIAVIATPTPLASDLASRNLAAAQPAGLDRGDVTPPADTVAAAAPPPGVQTVTIIDGSTGKRQQIAIPTPPDARTRAEQRMLEITRHGAIPKIAPDGARPAEVYSQAAKYKSARPDAAKVAIVVTGLGISTTATQDALVKLPGPVTLAFMPYGFEVDRAVARARAEGHEALLQLPMEPHDYPDNDPGPQTLLHTLSAEQNLDRLHWLMSRFPGYVGVASYMGARFTSYEPAMAPVLREIAKRGLIYFDDGSSPRSLAGQIAGANNLPFAKADVRLDAVASPAHIDKALSQLEAIARERGTAVGVSAALPTAIHRIAQWAKAAEARGIVLVPITAIAIKPKSS